MDPRTDPNSLIARVGGRWAGEDLQRTFQREVAELLNRRNQMGFPGAQPVSFASRHLNELKKQDYYLCEKTDGMRYLMYMTEDSLPDGTTKDIHYLIDRRNDYYFVPELHFPHQEDPTFARYHAGTILDGELVEDKYPGKPAEMKFLVFDCLVLDGTILMGRPLDKRLAYVKAHILEPYRKMFAKYPQEIANRPFEVTDKATEFSYSLEKMFRETIPRVKLLHGNDGLIFTCKNTPYKSGTDEHILKWKPPSENTIDFLLHIHWSTTEPDPLDPDQSLQDDYLAFPRDFGLYVFYGQNHGEADYRRHGTLYVTPQQWEELKALNKPLQDCIVECYLEVPGQEDSPSLATNGSNTANGSNNGNGNGNAHGNGTNGTAEEPRWRFHRLRDDKDEANHVSTYNSVIGSIEDHVTEEMLLKEAEEIRRCWKKRNASRA